ncbi:MAG: hypothetical protein J6Y84_01480 [Bacteroidaceae bacterium]|nr:hypothetical protein [Bacteroidaceae bacterium]
MDCVPLPIRGDVPSWHHPRMGEEIVGEEDAAEGVSRSLQFENLLI